MGVAVVLRLRIERGASPATRRRRTQHTRQSEISSTHGGRCEKEVGRAWRATGVARTIQAASHGESVIPMREPSCRPPCCGRPPRHAARHGQAQLQPLSKIPPVHRPPTMRAAAHAHTAASATCAPSRTANGGRQAGAAHTRHRVCLSRRPHAPRGVPNYVRHAAHVHNRPFARGGHTSKNLPFSLDCGRPCTSRPPPLERRSLDHCGWCAQCKNHRHGMCLVLALAAAATLVACFNGAS